jgi:hypothetical protein
MRDMIIIRGPQGSGKTSIVAACGLEGYHLSFDKIREVLCGDAMSPDGRMIISQVHNDLVYAMAMESLRRRIRTGETIVFEGTLRKGEQVDRPGRQPLKKEGLIEVAEMGRDAGYRILIVDTYGMSIERVKASNAQRRERLQVTDHRIETTYQEAEGAVLPDYAEHLLVDDTPESLARALRRIDEFVHEGRRPMDLSAYDKVVFVGDLQSTVDPLLDPASPLADGVRSDTAYVFVGDMFDRGVQTAGVAKFWFEHCHDRDNVFLLGGNHEEHVELQARGQQAVSPEWEHRTWPALQAAGYDESDMARIASRIIPFADIAWRGTKVFASHGGFPVRPTQPHLLAERDLRNGAGEYGKNVDARWNEAQAALPESERTWQVHGHRNTQDHPILTGGADGWSINLEDAVEFGGTMRFAVLDASGWTPISIRPKAFRTMVDEHLIRSATGRRAYGDEAPIMPWVMKGTPELKPLSAETIEKFRDHSMIGETVSTTKPTISSWNFTKSAFHTQSWDAYTSVARGLFVDNVDNTVVSRGAPKFYNAGERPETEIDAMLAANHGTAQMYAKENGFFATVGYSERLREMVVTSKSRIEGDFPDYANAMIDAKLGSAGRERMLRFCRDQQACLMFEVVDMTNDPHIIDEPEDKLVLLACIRRDEVFEQAPYATLVKLASWIGCDVKKLIHPNVVDARAFASIARRVGHDGGWRKDAPIEGLVVEFADGFMVKFKGLYYASWKKARGAVDRIAMARRKNGPFDRERYQDVPLIGEFLDWAQTLADEALRLNIIDLRNAWTGKPGAKHTRDEVEAMGPPPGAKTKDMSGFVRALEGMAASVARGGGKLESIARILASGANDPDKQAVIDAHPAAQALRDRLAAAEAGTDVGEE